MSGIKYKNVGNFYNFIFGGASDVVQASKQKQTNILVNFKLVTSFNLAEVVSILTTYITFLFPTLFSVTY